MNINHIRARQILDSRGNPTVEVDVYTDAGLARAGVPSGASTGTHEALELRDETKAYNGKAVTQAVNNVNGIIAEHLKGVSVLNQHAVDDKLIHLDGTPNKSKLGANAILGVSIAVCKAAALAKQQAWFQHIRDIYSVSGNTDEHFILPIPFMNVINGGKHAGNLLAFQEFMIAPTGAANITEGLQMGAEVYHKLKSIIQKMHGLNATNVGDEGGFAPPISMADEGLNLLTQAIREAGYEGRIKLGMDAAASELFNNSKYDVEFKKSKDKRHKLLDVAAMHKTYKHIVDNYPMISIEDPFDQEDFAAHKNLLAEVKQSCQIVGDDLLVTNPQRVKTAIEQEAANALLLKINQIGTISQALDAAHLAQQAGWRVMVSHRSGETEDPFIADLAVGINAGQIKTGAPCRTERTAKYNQLLRIEEELLHLQLPIKYGLL